jgi:hypothetical protein
MRESSTASGNPVRMLAIQDREDAIDGPGGTHFEQLVTTDGGGVPFGWDQDWGLDTGVTTFQQCDSNINGCPSPQNFIYPQLGMMAVWADPRNTSTTINDTFVRAFTW